MFSYQFLRHRIGRRGGAIDDGYQGVIAEQARAGWRLVQVLVEEPATVVTEYVLIFERPAD